MHATCRKVRAEWIHVAVAGFVTAALVPLWFEAMYGSEISWGWIAVAAGVSGTIGRAMARQWIRPR